MAAEILDDVLNNVLEINNLFEWLSLSKDAEKVMNQYECSQVEFASHFLNFLKEQTSRIFQSSCSVETPRKNSHIRIVKNLQLTPDVSSPTIQSAVKQTPDNSHLNLKSLHSFPALSSGSRKAKSCDKSLPIVSEKLSDDSFARNDNKENSSNRKLTRELFPQQSGSENEKNDISYLDDTSHTNGKENKFTVSTPKNDSRGSAGVPDYFNSIDRLRKSDVSPQYYPSPRWKKDVNRSDEFIDSKHYTSSSDLPKSRSFSGDNSFKSKDHKNNSRRSLGDFMSNGPINQAEMISTDYKKYNKKSKVGKRITPTQVKGDHKLQGLNSFSVGANMFEKNNSKDERYLLKKECESLSERLENKIDYEDVRFMRSPKSNKQTDPNLVTFRKELQTIAQIYSHIINENYCQNLMMELCFIVSLLVIQDYDKNELETDMKDLSLEENKKFLNSIHNCAFFAVEVLSLQKDILSMLNLAALNLLSKSTEIKKFSSELKDYLQRIYNEKQIRDDLKRQNAISVSRMQGNVSFQYETDNRENFSADTNFHLFRKQRDLFYEILKVWEDNHFNEGWTFSMGLGSKIKSLINICLDPINLLHLASLFRKQLIMSCCGENQTEEEPSEEIFKILASVDKKKMSLLQARLTTKSQGPCPSPDFSGYQEFFKNFILCTSSSVFHQHLKDSFCEEILYLNDTEFSSEVEDNGAYGTSFDKQTQDRYLHLVSILRLLAKFLGFVEFLPYRYDKPHTDRVVNLHCSVRQNLLPLFDLESRLKSAVEKCKLILTIPWVVSYLAMMDSCSARLNAYKNVWKLLITIYRRTKYCTNALTAFYLKLTLGWLFQLPNFPVDYFYSADPCPDDNIPPVDFNNGLNASDLVQENVLYAVCPYLNEIHVILSTDVGCNVRHIRPVTTEKQSYASSHASKQLELRLEENFLHNQSSSTRKTVDFVTERVASAGIKYLIHDVIPKIKDAALNEIGKCNPTSVEQAKAESEKISEKCYNELVSTCEKKFWEICFHRSEKAVTALLSSEVPEVVVSTCVQIVTREAIERVKRWTQSHISLGMISKEFSSIALKKFTKKQNDLNTSTDSICNKIASSKDSHRLPAEEKKIEHLNEAWSASHTLRAVRELIWKISEEGKIYEVEIENTLQEALKSLHHRADTIPVAEKTLFYLLVDLLVVASIHSENGIREETMEHFIKIFKHLDLSNYPNSNLTRIICPKNVMMIHYKVKNNKEKSWINLGELLLRLMIAELLTKDQMEEQLVSFLRETWDKEYCNNFTKLLAPIYNYCKDKNGWEEFSLLLEWLTETAKDINDTKEDSLDDY